MALINFSGLASGIDSSALIQAVIDQKRAALTAPLQSRVDENEKTNAALEQLEGLAKKLSTAAAKFRALSGGGISKQALSGNESVVTAAVTNAARTGNYGINVSALAAAATLSFDDRFSAASQVIYSGMNDGAPAADRTLSISTGTGSNQETVDIVMTSSTTVQDLLNAFNSQSSKAVASLINLGTSAAPSYAIVFTSNDTGTAKGEISLTVGSAITAGGAGAFNTYALQNAADAQFTVEGITGAITRQSNSVGDVIAGVTLNLQSTGAARISVSNDPDQTAAALKELVEAFNAVAEFIKENDAVTRQEKGGKASNLFGPLAKTTLDNNLLTSLRGALTAAGISGGEINTLADLGVTTQRDGTLKFDEETFRSAFVKDPGSAEKILEKLGESLAGTGGVIDQYTRFNGLFDAVIQANQSAVTALERQIGDLEARFEKEKEMLTQRYSRLESLIGAMQQQQAALSGILPKS